MSILRDLLEPDDFAGKPYKGGLNQGGHVVAGAALAAVLPLTLAVVAVLAFEAWQFWKKGATKADFRIDVAYWLVGAVSWSYAINSGLVTGFTVYAPALPLVAFVVEYARIKRGTNAET